jgi:type II secretory pathway pseudopilin PulG
MLKSKRSAFTLVELMIIVAIMADVMVVALPAYIRARNTAQNAKFNTDLRTAVSAFEMYAAENNRYPSDAGTSMIPAGMAQYLAGVPWSSRNSISTAWDWQPGHEGSTAAIRIISDHSLDDLRMQDIDIRMDNGILGTGNFRKVDEKNYYYIIE